jgi:hypothetical protein
MKSRTRACLVVLLTLFAVIPLMAAPSETPPGRRLGENSNATPQGRPFGENPNHPSNRQTVTTPEPATGLLLLVGAGGGLLARRLARRRARRKTNGTDLAH